jgi:hypothetical protein
VYLFHNVTQDVKMALAVDDILIGYRENSSCEMKEVKKIRIHSHIGDNYGKGEVIKGEIEEGDIAKEGFLGLLVILFNETCQH